MKSILVLTNCVAGLHSFRREVMKAIVDEGYTLYLSFPDKDERAKYFESIGCKLLDISFNRRGMNPIKDIKLLFDYVRIMKKIKPEAVDPDDTEMLEDLITVAVNEAVSNAIKTSEEEMGAITGGLNMPGLF